MNSGLAKSIAKNKECAICAKEKVINYKPEAVENVMKHNKMAFTAGTTKIGRSCYMKWLGSTRK